MSTKSEQYRAEEQRKGPATAKRNRSGSKPGVAPAKRSRSKTRAGKKATYAYEPTQAGKRPSRKSSRKSANRSKPDAAFNIGEEIAKTRPTARFRKDRAKATKTRGSKKAGGAS